MRIISISNQKGGCGKTTTAINLAACLAYQNRQVLLIDMDPQGHAALGLQIDPNQCQKTMIDTLFHPDGNLTPMDQITIEAAPNLDLAPCTISLSIFEQRLSNVPGREARLKEAISGLTQHYDYIVIDCPPSLGLLTFNALIASTEVFIPIEMSLFSLHGISKLLNIINMVHEKTGHQLTIKIIATMVDKRTRISREVLQNIKDHFAAELCVTTINTNVTLKEAAGHGKPIITYQNQARGSHDYHALAKEVLEAEKQIGHSPVKRKAPPVRKVQFTLHAPEANAVQLVGTFNNWEPSSQSALQQNDDGTWSRHLNLRPGHYQYRYIVDETWVEDSQNPNQVDNSFGGRNAVIDVD